MRNLDLNNSYYDTVDKNFNEALNLFEKNFSHNELISLIEEGNIPQKQFAVLQLDTIKTKEEAYILLHNLVGQDGKIREVVSMKIKDLTGNGNCSKLFNSLNEKELSEYFLAAIIDINGNICRNILDILNNFKDNKQFIELFIKKLIRLIFELLEKVKDFDFQDGKYKVNKEIFKLYWCLEAVNTYFKFMPVDIVKNIVNITKSINEYTIREKTAKILSNNIEDEELLKIRQELKSDKNYYVRRF